MSFDPTNHISWLAAAGAFGLWLWRVIALGAQIGKLVEKVDAIERRMERFEDRLNVHFDKKP